MRKLGFLFTGYVGQGGLLLFVTLVFTGVFHPEEVDAQNIRKELADRVAPMELLTGESNAGSDFSAVDANQPGANAPSTSQPEQVEKPPWHPNPVVIGSLMKLAEFFQISQNVLDSGPRILTTSEGTPRLDSQGRQLVVPAKRILNVLLVS